MGFVFGFSFCYVNLLFLFIILSILDGSIFSSFKRRESALAVLLSHSSVYYFCYVLPLLFDFWWKVLCLPRLLVVGLVLLTIAVLLTLLFAVDTKGSNL